MFKREDIVCVKWIEGRGKGNIQTKICKAIKIFRPQTEI